MPDLALCQESTHLGLARLGEAAGEEGVSWHKLKKTNKRRRTYGEGRACEAVMIKVKSTLQYKEGRASLGRARGQQM